MTDPLRYTVLIIDFPGACTLRERLLPTGASVHVVSSAAALIWARVKKIDAAFISFDDASTKPCEQLAGLGRQADHSVRRRDDGNLSSILVLANSARRATRSTDGGPLDPFFIERSTNPPF